MKKICRILISLLVKYLPKGKFVDFLIWQVSRRIFTNYKEIVQVDSNLKMSVFGDTPDMVNKSLLFASGYKKLAWESGMAYLVKAMAPKVQTAVVAGSHIGYYPLILSANNPNAKIYAFEPSPVNYSRFVENIKLNNFTNIKASDSALGNIVEDKKMFFDFAQSSFIDSNRKHFDVGIVHVTTLDTVFDNRNNPDLMIFDAEGYELNILKGGEKLIKNFTPDIIFEIDFRREKDEECIDFLASFGYKFFVIEDDYSSFDFTNKTTQKINLIPYNSFFQRNTSVNVFCTIKNSNIVFS